MNSKKCGACGHKAICLWNSDKIINCPYYQKKTIVDNYDYYSILKWSNDFTHLPTDRNLLVIVKDESGDHVNYYTQVAWVANTEPNTKPIWISDNEQVFDEVIMWGYLPEYENFDYE